MPRCLFQIRSRHLNYFNEGYRGNNMTTREAREIYLNSDCSYFLMCTNNYSGYIEYKRLGLQKTQEDVWKNEKLHMLSVEMQRTGDYRLLQRLYEIAVEFRDYEKLRLMLDALDRIKKPMTPLQRVDVSETILGRKFMRVRSGLVYWAYDNGQRGIAILLMDQVLQYLNIPNVTEVELERRIQKGKRLSKKIIEDLKLNFKERDFEEIPDIGKNPSETDNRQIHIWKEF